MSDFDESKVLHVQVFFDPSEVCPLNPKEDRGNHQIYSHTNVNDWMHSYLTGLGLSTFPTKCTFSVERTFGHTSSQTVRNYNYVMDMSDSNYTFGDYNTINMTSCSITIQPMKEIDYRVRLTFRCEEQPKLKVEYKMHAFDYVSKAIQGYIDKYSLHDSECTFKIDRCEVCTDNLKIRTGQLFDITGRTNGKPLVIQVTIKKYELKLSFPSGDGQSVRPDTTIVLKEMDLVKDVLKEYFDKEELIMFDSDYTVNGLPPAANLIARDMGVEPGSSVSTVCMMNTGPLEQLARVQARLAVAKATLKVNKRKYRQADVEGSILESVYTSGYHCKKKSIRALKRQLREFELDLSNTTQRYRKERVSKDKEINDAREEMDESKEMCNKLDAKRMRLETVVAVSTAESVAVSECIVCMDRIEKRGIVDCGQGHAEACINCYALLLATDQPCPTCRGKVTSVSACITGNEK